MTVFKNTTEGQKGAVNTAYDGITDWIVLKGERWNVQGLENHPLMTPEHYRWSLTALLYNKRHLIWLVLTFRTWDHLNSDPGQLFFTSLFFYQVQHIMMKRHRKLSITSIYCWQSEHSRHSVWPEISYQCCRIEPVTDIWHNRKKCCCWWNNTLFSVYRKLQTNILRVQCKIFGQLLLLVQ